jgi:hypothetical protein
MSLVEFARDELLGVLISCGQIESPRNHEAPTFSSRNSSSSSRRPGPKVQRHGVRGFQTPAYASFCPFVKSSVDIQPGRRLRTTLRTDRHGSWQIQSTFRDTSSRLSNLMFQPEQMGRLDEGSPCRRHSHNCPRLDRRIPSCDDLFRNRFQREGHRPAALV